MKPYWKLLLGLFLGCNCLFSCNAEELEKKHKNYNKPLSQALQQYQGIKGELYIRIVKKNYELSVMKGDSVVKTYPVVFGGNPIDDKKQQGDSCTPEGWFKVQSKYPHKSWSKFLWIDYPNTESRKRFAKRKAAGEIPQTASIGGDIGIHGLPKGYDHLIDEKYNWTLGCISLKNKDVNELYSFITVNKMRILIVKEL